MRAVEAGVRRFPQTRAKRSSRRAPATAKRTTLDDPRGERASAYVVEAHLSAVKGTAWCCRDLRGHRRRPHELAVLHHRRPSGRASARADSRPPINAATKRGSFVARGFVRARALEGASVEGVRGVDGEVAGGDARVRWAARPTAAKPRKWSTRAKQTTGGARSSVRRRTKSRRRTGGEAASEQPRLLFRGASARRTRAKTRSQQEGLHVASARLGVGCDGSPTPVAPPKVKNPAASSPPTTIVSPRRTAASSKLRRRSTRPPLQRARRKLARLRQRATRSVREPGQTARFGVDANSRRGRGRMAVEAGPTPVSRRATRRPAEHDVGRVNPTRDAPPRRACGAARRPRGAARTAATPRRSYEESKRRAPSPSSKA